LPFSFSPKRASFHECASRKAFKNLA